ncbi:hypothetical protein LMH73_014475 [Vibrio splendidus]|nr:hypothetical protein [Vibrio splendidus]MCC4882500.1 hypothetical protein [Vibrio splendidus]
MENNEIIQCVIENDTLNNLIKNAAIDNPSIDWGVCDITDEVEAALGIEIDIHDTDLFGVLLPYFNGKSINSVGKVVDYIHSDLTRNNSRECSCDYCLGREAFQLGYRIELIKKTHSDYIDGFVAMQEETGKDHL